MLVKSVNSLAKILESKAIENDPVLGEGTELRVKR